MATRLYFGSVPQTVISGTINGDFAGSYSGFNRYFFESTPTDAFVTLTNTTASHANNTAYCVGQWWSHRMSNAPSLNTAAWNASTFTTLMRFSEGLSTSDLFYRWQLRVWDGSFVNNSYFNGGTEFDVGNGATTNSVMESRRCSGCDYWGATMPALSDQARLVLEVGIYRSTARGAESTTAYCEIGGNSGTDLSNDQLGTSQFNPWMETSLDITFSAEDSESQSRLMLMGVG